MANDGGSMVHEWLMIVFMMGDLWFNNRVENDYVRVNEWWTRLWADDKSNGWLMVYDNQIKLEMVGYDI